MAGDSTLLAACPPGAVQGIKLVPDPTLILTPLESLFCAGFRTSAPYRVAYYTRQRGWKMIEYRTSEGGRQRPLLRRQNATTDIPVQGSGCSRLNDLSGGWIMGDSWTPSPSNFTGVSSAFDLGSPSHGESNRSCGKQSRSNSAGANSTRSAIGVGNNIHGHPRSFSGSNSPCPVEIVNTMPASEIIQHLVEHQCPDITKFLDLASCGEHPVSGGGFGDIYRARLLDGVQVAIKCARFPMDSRGEAQSALKRSAHELYVWSRCQHRNLLQLFGFAEFRGRIAMVSPWMDNGSLSEYVSRNPQVDRCRLCVEVAEGLTYLHSMGSVHGDLKASNVFVSREGVVKLADFGNTRLQNYTLGFARSAEGWCISLRWTAPELLGEQPEPLSRETDVYALGMTVLEIITGRLPYSDLSEHAVMVAVALRKARPKRPYGFIPSESDAGEALWWMLNLCWAADPKNRPDAFSVRDALIGITQEGLMARDSYIMVD